MKVSCIFCRSWCKCWSSCGVDARRISSYPPCW